MKKVTVGSLYNGCPKINNLMCGTKTTWYDISSVTSNLINILFIQGSLKKSLYCTAVQTFKIENLCNFNGQL